jgi:hypothetical protein
MTTFHNLLTSALVLVAGAVLVQPAAAQYGTATGLKPATLKAVATAEKAPNADGFLQRWLLLEPISIGNQQAEGASKAAVKKEYFPNQLTVLPHDGDKVTVGDAELTWHALDTTLYNVNLYQFAHVQKKSADGAMFWAVTIVNCPKDMPNVRLAIGSNASSVWWVNGQEVTGVYGDRQTVIDDGVSKRLTLKKGPNIVRGVIINGSGATDFCARFLDADDKPLTGFTTTVGEVKQP